MLPHVADKPRTCNWLKLTKWKQFAIQEKLASNKTKNLHEQKLLTLDHQLQLAALLREDSVSDSMKMFHSTSHTQLPQALHGLQKLRRN